VNFWKCDSRGLWLTRLASLLLGASVIGLGHQAWSEDEMQPRSLRVMSFNVRYAAAADGKNSWPLRQELLLQTIKTFAPDLLGTQETLPVQAEFLKDKLSGYTLIGVGRDDGKQRGEQSALLFKTDRFELLDSGHFWLSETPDVPGSKSWDSALPRMVTWARLGDRRVEGKKLMYLNTHFDHQGQRARVEAAKLMRRWLSEHAAGQPIVITGDFNATESNEVYQQLVKADDRSLLLLDAYRETHPKIAPTEGTFHGFSGIRNGWRIDWILHSAHLKATAAEIDCTSKDGCYPSDHFPVTAVLDYEQ
jgi:endonuclease/exonuclease/phosphatase family metal-dependent hydrolase